MCTYTHVNKQEHTHCTKFKVQGAREISIRKVPPCPVTLRTSMKRQTDWKEGVNWTIFIFFHKLLSFSAGSKIFMQQFFFLKLVVFSCLLFNLGVFGCCRCCCCCSLRTFYSKATVWRERDGSPEWVLPSAMPWASGFCGEPSFTFQSHFGAYKVNTFFKLFISADEGDWFFFLFHTKGHLY